MSSPFHLFISSTSQLDDERRALDQELSPNYTVYLAENDHRPIGSSSTPEGRVREAIEKSHVFVLLLGRDYGSTVSAKDSRSIVQWEFDTARELKVDVVGFEQANARRTSDTRQHQFIQRVTAFGGGIWRNLYNDTAELVTLVTAGLNEWHRTFHEERALRCRKVARKAESRIVIFVVAAFIAFCTLLTVPGVPSFVLSGLAVCMGAIILAAIVLLYFLINK